MLSRFAPLNDELLLQEQQVRNNSSELVPGRYGQFVFFFFVISFRLYVQYYLNPRVRHGYYGALSLFSIRNVLHNLQYLLSASYRRTRTVLVSASIRPLASSYVGSPGLPEQTV